MARKVGDVVFQGNGWKEVVTAVGRNDTFDTVIKYSNRSQGARQVTTSQHICGKCHTSFCDYSGEKPSSHRGTRCVCESCR